MPPAEPLSIPAISSFQRRIVLVGMMCGVSLAAIDQMVLSTAVGRSPASSATSVRRPGSSRPTCSTSAASHADLGQARRSLRPPARLPIGDRLFIVGVAARGAESDSMIELLVCRALQGLGGGALLTMPYAIVGDVVAPRDRPAYVAFVSVVWTDRGLPRPAARRPFVEGPGWRWMFYINVPAAIAPSACCSGATAFRASASSTASTSPAAALLFSRSARSSSTRPGPGGPSAGTACPALACSRRARARDRLRRSRSGARRADRRASAARVCGRSGRRWSRPPLFGFATSRSPSSSRSSDIVVRGPERGRGGLALRR